MSQAQKRKFRDSISNGDDTKNGQNSKMQKNEVTRKQSFRIKLISIAICILYFPLEQVVLRRGGNLLSCGQNEVGQLGLDDNVSEKTRPALVPVGSNATGNIIDISAGGMHSLYLTKNGEVFSFGCNDEGALGRDTSAEGAEYESGKVDLPGKCQKISAGDSHSAFLLENAKVFACGSFRDSHGTMGLNVKGKQQFPVEVVPGEEFVDIESGADHLVLCMLNIFFCLQFST